MAVNDIPWLNADGEGMQLDLLNHGGYGLYAGRLLWVSVKKSPLQQLRRR